MLSPSKISWIKCGSVLLDLQRLLQLVTVWAASPMLGVLPSIRALGSAIGTDARGPIFTRRQRVQCRGRRHCRHAPHLSVLTRHPADALLRAGALGSVERWECARARVVCLNHVLQHVGLFRSGHGPRLMDTGIPPRGCRHDIHRPSHARVSRLTLAGHWTLTVRRLTGSQPEAASRVSGGERPRAPSLALRPAVPKNARPARCGRRASMRRWYAPWEVAAAGYLHTCLSVESE